MGMPKFKFLSSYAKLKEFVDGLRDTLAVLPDEKKRELILMEVAAFSINKNKTDDRRQLQSNDYFTSIIGGMIDPSIVSSSEVFSLYAEVVRYLLPLAKVDRYVAGPDIHGFETIVFSNQDSVKGSFFLVADDKLSSYLSGYYKNLPKHNIENSKIPHEQIILFEDPNTGIFSEFKNNPNSEDFKSCIIGSLYTLFTYILKFDSQFLDSELGDSVAKDLVENGYSVVPNFIDLKMVKELKDITYSIARNQAETGSAYVYGNEARLQRIYNLIGKHDIYWNLLLDERVKTIVETFFKRNTLHDKYFLSSYQANILYPGATAQILHTDLSMPEPLPPWPVRLNVNLAIDEFTTTNGATLVMPGSHLSLKKPNAHCENSPLIPVTVPCGSLVIWTGHLWHKSGANSSDKPRAALLACFAASYLRELAVEENYLAITSSHLLNRMPRPLKSLIGGFHGIKKGA